MHASTPTLRFRAATEADIPALVELVTCAYRGQASRAGWTTEAHLLDGPRIDPQVLATVTAWAARLNVLATDMRVEQRSLEDVFLDLTGRELRS